MSLLICFLRISHQSVVVVQISSSVKPKTIFIKRLIVMVLGYLMK